MLARRDTHETVPAVTVIVVSWNTRDLLARCLESLASTAADLDVEVAVVDNGSTDGSLDMLRSRFPRARVLANSENVGFGRAVNQAARASNAPYLLLLNSDAALSPGALASLLAVAESHPRAGLVGACIRNPDGTFQGSYAPFPNLGREFLILSGLGRLLFGSWYPSRGPWMSRQLQAVDWVSGACVLVRRAAFDALGGFDEGYFLQGEEMDLCFRMRGKGWNVWYQPDAKAVHEGGGSSRGRNRDLIELHLYRGRLRFFSRHRSAWQARMLRAQILAFSLIKICFHGVLRRLTGGRRGRPVPAWRQITRSLQT